MSLRTSRFVRRSAIAGVSLAVGLGIGVGAGTTIADAIDDPATAAAPTVIAGQPVATTSSGTVADIADAALPGVVDILVSGVSNTSQGLDPFGGQGPQAQGEGSGFVLDDQGHIVTNSHVVDGANSITVRFADGSEAKAQLVGSDPSSDIAVIKVAADAAALHPLPLGTSADLEVGEGVVAIGSPFGLQGTVTTGIVSALGRSMQAPNGYTITGAIQTDAAINHGNSGGPLLDGEGKVIGVNAQIESQSGGNDGIGFAIPVETAQKVAGQLVSGGQVSHAYLGVSVTTIDASASDRLGVPQGAQVGTVQPGSPAAEAGLKASGAQNGQPVAQGDVITAVDGEPVTTAEGLTAAVAAHAAGDKVTLTVVSGGERHEVHVTLGERPA